MLKRKGTKMSDPNNFSGTYKDFLNINEACKYLDLSKSYLYKLTHLRKIPHYKPGKKIYFKKEDVDNYIFRNRIKTESEIQAQAEQKLNSLRGL